MTADEIRERAEQELRREFEERLSSLVEQELDRAAEAIEVGLRARFEDGLDKQVEDRLEEVLQEAAS